MIDNPSRQQFSNVLRPGRRNALSGVGERADLSEPSVRFVLPFGAPVTDISRIAAEAQHLL
jgi:hypothetical protein